MQCEARSTHHLIWLLSLSGTSMNLEPMTLALIIRGNPSTIVAAAERASFSEHPIAGWIYICSTTKPP